MQTTERTVQNERTAQKRTGEQGDRSHLRGNIKQPPALSTLYFAYGSNLNQEQMQGRCPTAMRVGPLTLPDWRLEFRGVADIVPFPGAEVAGALYRVWEQDVLALDRYEGYRRSAPEQGLYRKVYRKLQDAEGRVRPFMFYVMNESGLWPPQPHYLETIRRGFADWHLPADTLEDAVLRSQPVRLQRKGSNQGEFEDFLTGDLFDENYRDV